MGNEISTASCWTANESPKASALMMMMTTTERTTTTATSKQEQSNSSSNSNSKYHHHHKKKLLFGCQTDEEHDEYVKEVCSAIANKRGQDGLSILGLEFHKWHHPKTCTCPLPASSSSSIQRQQQQQKKQDKDKENELVTTTMTTSHDLTTKETFTTVCSSSTVEEEDEKQRQRQKTKVVYRRDVSSLSRDDDDDDDDDDDSISKELTFVDTTTTKEEEEEFMVPIGEPISRENSMADLNQAITFGSRMGSERSASTAFTMFSLATHHSYISGGDGSSSSSSDGRGGDNGDGNYYGSSSGSDNFETCSIRLYHKSTNTCITEKNHEFFIAHGKMYDEVARLCMEYAQDIMIQEGELEWQHVGDGVGALVSRNRRRRCLQQQQQLQKNKKKPVLLIVTGKGKVRAGIFSRRHLMTSGLEVSTALPFIRGANERNMNVIMLDPNVNGTQKAMKAVQSSLEKLFFDQQQQQEEEEEEESTTTNTNTCNDKEDLYILAHSMAGSQLTRFLHDNTFIKKDDNNPRSSTSPTTASRIIPKNIKAGKDFLRQIKRVSFTDSNHNINWCKKNPPVTELLVGEASLYIKSHKPHDEKKQLGQLHHDCQFWKHRFGTIKTIWGGTSEHALTNYTGRDYIWDHFDSFLDDDE